MRTTMRNVIIRFILWEKKQELKGIQGKTPMLPSRASDQHRHSHWSLHWLCGARLWRGRYRGIRYLLKGYTNLFRYLRGMWDCRTRGGMWPPLIGRAWRQYCRIHPVPLESVSPYRILFPPSRVVHFCRWKDSRSWSYCRDLLCLLNQRGGWVKGDVILYLRVVRQRYWVPLGSSSPRLGCSQSRYSRGRWVRIHSRMWVAKQVGLFLRIWPARSDSPGVRGCNFLWFSWLTRDEKESPFTPSHPVHPYSCWHPGSRRHRPPVVRCCLFRVMKSVRGRQARAGVSWESGSRVSCEKKTFCACNSSIRLLIHPIVLVKIPPKQFP